MRLLSIISVYCGFILFHLLAPLAFASTAQEVNIQAPPSWVIESELSAIEPSISNAEKTSVRGGVFYRLVDSQVKVDVSGERASYTRYIDEVINETGLDESSQININFDPEYQEIIFHSLSIIRDGKQLDRITTAKMSILNRETELKNQIYNGKLTLNILINDLRIGDTIDYSYTRLGANPVYKNIFAYAKKLTWSTPVHEQRVRILWGKPTPLFVTQRNIDATISQRNVDGFVEYKLRVDQQVAIDEPSETPYWYDPYGLVYFSETDNWKQVNDWARPMYDLPLLAPASLSSLPIPRSSVSVQQIAARILAENKSPAEQIVAALQYTQESIRYVGLEMGQNSHLPTQPQQTIDLAYGDCKDKTLLLIAILQAMGIESSPALVNTSITKLVNDLPPRVNAFNHVLVTLVQNDKRLWLDPTLSKQDGDLANIYQPDFGYALILSPGQDALTEMNTDTSKSSLHVTETYIIPKFTPQEVKFDVQTQYRGSEAARKKTRILKDGLQQVSNDYEVYYQGTHPSLEARSEMTASTNPDNGVLSVNESYRIAKFWQEEEHFEADFYPYEIRSAVFKPKQVKRDAPLAFDYPNNIKFDLVLDFKSDNWEFDDEDFEEDNDFFRFTKTERFAEDVLTVSYNYRAKADYIAQDRLDDYLEARERLLDAAYFSIVKYRINEQSSEPLAAVDEDDPSQKVFWYVGAVYVVAFLVMLLSWRQESHRRPVFESAHFYPIDLAKFIILSVLTAGIYFHYWAYRNWKAIKEKEASDIMPIARGIFSIIWFYPLFARLKADSLGRFERNKVMPTALAIVFAVAFVVLTYGRNADDSLLTLFQYFITILLFIPLINYINKLNAHDDKAQKYNSSWRIRHVLLALVMAPVFVFAAIGESHLLPSDEVVTQANLMDHDKTFLYRKRVLPPTEEIIYFYSDSAWSNREDGNGFTQNRVFSYWVDEKDSFSLQSATFEEISSIDVEYNQDTEGTSLITITRNDGSDFLLFVSNINDGDERFAEVLMSTWKPKEADVTNREVQGLESPQ